MRQRLSTPALATLLTAAVAAEGATFSVSNKADAGAGSLRQAILDANATPGRDVITFHITGAQPWNIVLATELPAVTDPLVIDGTSQPGYAGAPLVGIVGANAPAANGLTLNTFDCEVRGLAINRFKGDGIRLRNGGRHVVAGNYIGTSISGNSSLGNRHAGITVMGSAQNVIGGTNASDRNVISGNQTGVHITGASAISNHVQGNFIGTDVDGISDIGNTNNGVLLYDTTGNIIGGSAPGARNVISGNNQSGVYLLRSTNGNRICGNLIGTSASGLAALGNRLDGVKIDSSAGNLIGGGAGEGNVISGNRERGVHFINDSQTNSVEGNLIGVAVNGITPLGNRYAGVGLAGASFNSIGGTNAAARNVISGNLQSGIIISDASCLGNRIMGNFIGTDISGSNSVANAFNGVSVSQGRDNIVGGCAAARNVISGNAQHGVLLQGGNTTVAGNFIGTDVSGVRRLGNGLNGVRIESAANLIGGSAAGLGNLISGNGATFGSGVLIAGTGASNNVLSRNLIGTDSTGAAPLPNAGAGIGITNAPRNQIGGPGLWDGNTISGNADTGVYLIGAASTANQIAGNIIGADVTGMTALSNGFGGVYLHGAAGNTFRANTISGNAKVGVFLAGHANVNVFVSNRIGLQRNGTGLLGNEWHGIELTNVTHTIIGGTMPGSGNRIAGARTAGYDGVRMRNGTDGNVVRGNCFFSNGGASANGLGIDLGVDGVTLNDPVDADAGANAQQNFPVIATASGCYATLVTGTLHSQPDSVYTIDFYGNMLAEPGGFGEGERWLGGVTVTTSPTGDALFSGAFTNWFGAGAFISATATDALGNTSEFSLAKTVAPADDSDVDGMPDDYESAAALNPLVAAGSTQDIDGDGASDLEEFQAGTDPRDASAHLRVTLTHSANGFVLSFPTVPGKIYTVFGAAEIAGPWTPVVADVAGTGADIYVLDTHWPAVTRFFNVRIP